MMYYDGDRLRLVAWRTPRGVYWVSNTLLADADQQRRCRASPIAAALGADAAAPRGTWLASAAS